MLRTVVLLSVLATPALAQDFPLTIHHNFGEAVIPVAPQRVATVDYAGADNVLALGFQPLTARMWFGPYDNALWPWASAQATGDPVVLNDPLDFEAIAATNPDVILALRSGITGEDYAKLTAIAPVVAVPAGRGDYDLTWDEQAMLAGRALGQEAKALELVAGVKAQIAQVAADHPDWAGKTFAMLTWYDGAVGLYSATDSSVKLLEQLGLTIHPEVAALSQEGEFYISISQEILPDLDADVIVWYAEPGAAEIDAITARKSMRASAEGREVFLGLDSPVNGALSHGSLLSLPEAVTLLAPMLDAALDGNPETPVVYEAAK